METLQLCLNLISKPPISLLVQMNIQSLIRAYEKFDKQVENRQSQKNKETANDEPNNRKNAKKTCHIVVHSFSLIAEQLPHIGA